MNLKARLSNGNLVDLKLQESHLTVRQLKDIIHETYGESLEVRLIVKGKILQEDENFLSDYNIIENDTIHVAKPKASSYSSSTPPLSAQKLRPAQDPMDDIMGNPMVEAMMSNPAFMRSIMQSNPQVQQMIQQMPELAEAMNDPAFFQELSKGARNPKLRQEMQRNQDRTLANIESMPGGMQHLSSMFKTLSNTTSKSDDGIEEADKKLALLLLGDQASPSSDRPNDMALPNPWAPRNKYSRSSPMSQSAPASTTMMNPMMPLLFTQPSPSASSARTAANPYNFMQQYAMMQQQIQPSRPPTSSQSIPITVEPVEIRYRDQLETMREMGFENDDLNKKAILAASGDLDGAVDYIINQSPDS